MISPQSTAPADETQQAKRLFIALACPLLRPVAQAMEELHSLAAASAGRLKVVNENTLHVTLKFLGSTPDAKLAALCRTLDVQARTSDRFAIELAGTGCFPGVLWLGVRSNPALVALAEKIELGMQTLGFAAETRSFRPHVTVARIKRGVEEGVKEGAEPPAERLAVQWQQRFFRTAWGDVPVSAITLYSSVTSPQGAMYTALHHANLRRD